jgi:hypothetical protein
MRKHNVPVDDQHTLMMQHLNLYEDTVHFGPEGANIMGDQVTKMISSALQK